MQVPFKSNDIAPQLLHLFIFDLYELKPININRSNKKGIKNIRIMTLPRKLIIKLKPKIGIITNAINK